VQTLEDRINEQDKRCCDALVRIGEDVVFIEAVAELHLLRSQQKERREDEERRSGLVTESPVTVGLTLSNLTAMERRRE
jgi:hypothetical protein